MPQDLVNFRAFSDAIHIVPTTSSQRVTLASSPANAIGSTDVMVHNSTDKVGYYKTGDATVVATKLSGGATGATSSTPIAPGAMIVFRLQGDTNAAALTETAPTSGTISFTVGNGS
jgi:hypothetical protein